MKILALTFTCLFLVVPCQAKIITVDDDGPANFNNIRAAIDDSNNGDIILVLPGRYTGNGNRDIDFGGRAITVKSENGPENCIIDCKNSGRGFYFHSGENENSVLDGFTITGGNTSGNGGGIYCGNHSNPTITNCTIYDNSAADGGGGIYCNNSNPTITDCTINSNSGKCYEGGGIYCDNYSCPLISDCNISRNRACNPGGGMYCNNHSCPIITNSTISYNRACDNDDGGGIYCEDYSCPIITNCNIIRNQVGGADGGGIYCYFYSNPIITNSIISGNMAFGGNGGGIYCYHRSEPTITNCMISGNRATQWSSGGNGGGIYCKDESSATITNCTISANSAGNEGGGIFYYDGSLASLLNCILWFNADSNGTDESAQITYDVVPEVMFSCIQDSDPNDSYIPFGGANNYNIDDNPMFVRDPNDGGDGWGVGFNDDFGDLHLQLGSPCINAGDPNIVVGNQTDIDGQPRIFDGCIDMGADEFAPMIVVTKPQGGEVWSAGSTHEIEWFSYVPGAVDILFSIESGSSWQMIEGSVPDTGSYTWHLPGVVESNQCMVLVVPSATDSNFVYIESGVFTIQHYPRRPAAPRGRKSRWDNFRRTGLSENYGPELGCVKWQFETDGAISASVTVGPNDTVYVPCEDGNLYTLDANGVSLWSYDANSPLVSSPAVGYYGMVYVGSKDGKLYAIDGKGKLRWTHSTNGPIYSSPAVSADGNIYVCSQDGILYTLAPDGSELWSFETDGFSVIGGSIFASPTIGTDGTIYIAGLYDPNLYALDPNDGSVKWVCNFESGGWPFASSVIAADSTVYQTLLYDQNLYAIDQNNGQIIWSTWLADPYSGWFDSDYNIRYAGHTSCWSEPALGPDGTVYVSFDDPYLRAVDPNGSIKWVTRLGMMGGFTLTVGSDGLVYAASDDGYLCVVDANGCEVARFDSNDYWLSFPVISADNTIVVGDSRDNSMLISYNNNKVWALGGDDCEGQVAALHRPQDLSTDWSVDYIDLALLVADWLACTDTYLYPPDWQPLCDIPLDEMYLTGDVDRNLYVDFADFATLANRWLAGY